MAKIKKLSGSIINQIAAGEVVIQPCSVIKELVENSFDAGATRVEVEFNGSGADGLKVMDNGMGLEAEDLQLAIEPHATSKIQNAADLYQVVSCGFRGEALASIAEVSHLEIISRTRDSDKAHRLYKNGESYDVESASRAQGTTVNMQHLFHNVPVRRRFLKTDRSETSHNLDILKKLALSRPGLGLKVKHDQKMCFDLPEDQALEARVRDLGIFEKKAELKEISKEREGIRVSGVIVAPPLHFGNSQKIFFFINRRPIKDKALAQAVIRGFSSYIPERRFPGAVVHIDMDAEEVDVNIHPTKSEVRFRQSEIVFKAVYGAVRSALEDSAQFSDAASENSAIVYKSSGTPKTIPMNRRYGGVHETPMNPFTFDSPTNSQPQAFSRPQSNSQPQAFSQSSSATSYAGQFSSDNQASIFSSSEDQFTSSDSVDSLGENEPESEEVIQSFKSDELPRCFQVLNRFIIIEKDEGMEIMDQHAIHERVLFNQLAHEEEKKSFNSQMLMMPTLLPLPEKCGDISGEIMKELDFMGYRLALSDDGETIEIQGIPDFLSPEKAATALEGMLCELSEGLAPNKESLRRK
ncbi:MAG: DNA mismatch repair endonuclease MutL, partial [Planctomycetes bacterium]|nr:DNA mismatch repair endonuclease MutL [Planctomycetota bacterium]